MSKKSPKIPTPQDINNPNKALEEAKDKVLSILVASLTQRKPGDKGNDPIYTDHVDPMVRQAVIADLEAQGWSVQIQKIYGGRLHWYVRPAA